MTRTKETDTNCCPFRFGNHALGPRSCFLRHGRPGLNDSSSKTSTSLACACIEVMLSIDIFTVRLISGEHQYMHLALTQTPENATSGESVSTRHALKRPAGTWTVSCRTILTWDVRVTLYA
jgi:hypothetical protein